MYICSNSSSACAADWGFVWGAQFAILLLLLLIIIIIINNNNNNNAGWFTLDLLCIWMIMEFETLSLKCCALNLRELTVRPISVLRLWISEGLTQAES